MLKGITDDDFITWFDKTELGSLKTNTGVDNICECGRICKREEDEFQTTSTSDVPTEIPITVTTSNTELNKDTTTITSKGIEITTQNEVSTTSSSELATTENNTIFSTVINFIETKSTTQNNDDPIIIPTATYVNNSIDNQKTENKIPSLIPSGELIIQKLSQTKVKNNKDIDFRKKSLPRRKGTLKATYGDKQERFFHNISAKNSNNVSAAKELTLTVKNQSQKIEMVPTANISTGLLLKNDIVNKTSIKSDIITNHSVVTQNSTIKLQNKIAQKSSTVNNSISEATKIATFPPHIATVTKSNIRNIFHKPKTVTKNKLQEKSSKIWNNITKNENISSQAVKANITKYKNITKDKYFIKSYKSINKEIHKIPAVPISETSKTLQDISQKKDVAPDNRDGYEILEKNNLWDLLKEGPELDSMNVENKLNVHARIGVVAQNASASNISRRST